jgi:hypothetical protein
MKRILTSLIVGLLLTACQTTSRHEGARLQVQEQPVPWGMTMNGMPVSP